MRLQKGEKGGNYAGDNAYYSREGPPIWDSADVCSVCEGERKGETGEREGEGEPNASVRAKAAP